MKKILFAVIIFAALLNTSCSNDPIGVDVKNTIRRSDLKLNITTTSAYEKFGLTDYQDYIGSNNSVRVAVISLLYDSNGKLIETKSSYEKTFSPISQTFESLADGKYTVVTFETLVDANNNNKSDYWDLSDTESLETLKIQNKSYHVVSWENSIGISSKSIDITSNAQMSISPSPIGVLLDFSYENFEKSGYFWLGFELRNTASGYLLNPSLPASQRYTYDQGYNDKHVWSGRASFYEANGLKRSDSGKFYMLESGNIQYCFAPSDSITTEGDIVFDGTFPSSESYFNFVEGTYYKALCYYTGYSKSIETIIGTQQEYTALKNQMLNRINEMPLMEEPYLIWNGNVIDVQTYMREYNALNDVPEQLSSLYRLSYDGKNKEFQIGYLFTSETTGLFIVNVFFNPNAISENDITSYLIKEGYKFSSNKDGDLIYVSSIKQTQARVTVNSNGKRLIQFSEYRNLFKEPYLNWGGSVVAVKSYMSGYSLNNETPEKNGDYYGLSYNGKDKELGYDYYFTSETGGLAFVNVFFNPDMVGEDEITEVLIDNGYSLALYQDDISYYLSNDSKTVAAFLLQNQGYWVVQYFPYSNSARLKSPAKKFSTIQSQVGIIKPPYKEGSILISNKNTIQVKKISGILENVKLK